MNIDKRKLIFKPDKDCKNEKLPEVDSNYKLGDRRFVPENAPVNVLLIGSTCVGKTAMR